VAKIFYHRVLDPPLRELRLVAIRRRREKIFASGVGVTGGGLVSAGAAKAGAIVRQKIKEPAKADVMAKTRREVRSTLIGQRNSIRERKASIVFLRLATVVAGISDADYRRL